jgi:hypothetical protein
MMGLLRTEEKTEQYYSSRNRQSFCVVSLEASSGTRNIYFSLRL